MSRKGLNSFSEYQISDKYFPELTSLLNDVHSYHREEFGSPSDYGSHDNASWISHRYLEETRLNNFDNLVVGLGPFFDFVNGKARYVKREDPAEHEVQDLRLALSDEEFERCWNGDYFEETITPADTFKSISVAEESNIETFYPSTLPDYVEEPDSEDSKWYHITRDTMVEGVEKVCKPLDLRRDQHVEKDHNDLLIESSLDLEGDTVLVSLSEDVLEQSKSYGTDLVVYHPKFPWQLIENDELQ